MAKYNPPPQVTPRNDNQRYLIEAIESFDLTIVAGPAGTGKTYVATKMAAKLLREGLVDRIIVSRPMMVAEEDPGALPGDIKEKFAPFFAPVRDILLGEFGPQDLGTMERDGRVMIAPLAYIRGSSFDRAFMLLDEAQNTTETQMKLYLTRAGMHTKVCLCGDPEQIDGGITKSGLVKAVQCLGSIDGVGLVIFREADCVRSPLVRKVLRYFK